MSISELHWSLQAGFPILALLQLLPLAAMAGCMALRGARWLFPFAVAAGLAELALAVELYRLYDHTRSAMQFAERVELMGPLVYHAAADGMSVLFVLLTALLTLMVTLYGRIRELTPQWRLLATVFAVEAALMGMFVTVDLLWFSLLSAAELVLVGYLVWRWATSAEAELALARYLQFMATGLLLLVIGMVMLGWNYADAGDGTWSFNLFNLLQAPIPHSIQSVLFFLFFYALAVRIPLFPMHGWLPLVAEHGTVGVAPVFLLGLKVGVYGLLRFVFPLLQEAVVQWHAYVVAFALAGVFYAATLALMQINLRRLLAFAVVSHTSVLVIGLFTLGHTAFQGSVMLAVNFGLAGAGLFFATGMIYARTGTALLPQLGGLFDRIPLIGVTFFIAGLSIVGMPGTPGFDAVHLMLEAAMARFGALVTIAAALGNVVAAGFLLYAFQRAFLTPPREEIKRAPVATASMLERLLAAGMIVVLLGAGFFSEPWLELIETSLEGLSALYGEGH